MSNLPTIPEVRGMLQYIADELDENAILYGAPWAAHQAAYIRSCVSAMYRRRPPRKAKPTSNPMTPQLKQLIVATAAANPDWSYQQIAEYVGVNAGRVSETLTGFR